MKSLRLAPVLAVFLCFSGITNADEKSVNPKVAKIVEEVNEARIKATIAKLVSFGTRNTMSTQELSRQCWILGSNT